MTNTISQSGTCRESFILVQNKENGSFCNRTRYGALEIIADEITLSKAREGAILQDAQRNDTLKLLLFYCIPPFTHPSLQ